MKYLVPTDFSKIANHALDFACDMAKKTGAEIHLLHVLEIPSSSYSTTGEFDLNFKAENLYEALLIRSSKDRLNELAQKVTDQGLKAEIYMKYGNPFRNIQGIITEHKADLVIMGSTGASGLTEILIGSNAERVIRNAHCPVITVKGKTSFEDIKEMVYATTTSIDHAVVVKEVKNLQKLFGWRINLLRVVTARNFLTRGKAKEQLEDFAEKYGFNNFTMNVDEAEFADEGIVKWALDHNNGMIVMGTAGRTGLAHIIGGSKAEAVANHSHIPVMTVKLPDDF